MIFIDLPLSKPQLGTLAHQAQGFFLRVKPESLTFWSSTPRLENCDGSGCVLRLINANRAQQAKPWHSMAQVDEDRVNGVNGGENSMH